MELLRKHREFRDTILNYNKNVVKDGKMPLSKLKIKKIKFLLRSFFSTKEHREIKKYIREFAPVKKRGYLTKVDLIKVCRWKFPHAKKHIKLNSEQKILRITKKVFRIKSEKTKRNYLTRLSGVNVPMASLILMLTDPERFKIIDIRIWNLLYKSGIIKTNSGDNNFKFKEWYKYLIIICCFAKKLKVKARDFEKILFNVHSRYQKDNLYDEN